MPTVTVAASVPTRCCATGTCCASPARPCEHARWCPTSGQVRRGFCAQQWAFQGSEEVFGYTCHTNERTRVSDLVFRDLDQDGPRAAPSTTRGRPRCARSSRSCARCAPRRGSSRPPTPATARRAPALTVRPPRPRGMRRLAGAGEHAGEGLDDGRVELRAGVGAELDDREGLPRRPAIGPVRRHRLEGVGDQDDRATPAGSSPARPSGLARARGLQARGVSPNDARPGRWR